MMYHRGTTDYYFCRINENEEEIDYDLTVEYAYYPGCKETREEPAEDPEVEILSMTPDIELTDEEYDRLEQKILDEQ